MDFNKWNKYGKKMTYLWDRPLYEHIMQKSRVDVKNGVFELYYNAVAKEPINPIDSQNKIGRALKKLFKADKYICVVTKSHQMDNGEYKHNVQFYYRPVELPSEEQMAKIEDIINDNSIVARYKRRSKDFHFKYYEFSELPGSQVEISRILQQCNGEIKRTQIQGGIWFFA